MAKNKTRKSKKVIKLKNNRHNSGRKKLADKKKLVPSYIRESEIIKLGGVEAAAESATKHLIEKAASIGTLSPLQAY